MATSFWEQIDERLVNNRTALEWRVVQKVSSMILFGQYTTQLNPYSIHLSSYPADSLSTRTGHNAKMLLFPLCLHLASSYSDHFPTERILVRSGFGRSRPIFGTPGSSGTSSPMRIHRLREHIQASYRQDISVK